MDTYDAKHTFFDSEKNWRFTARRGSSLLVLVAVMSWGGRGVLCQSPSPTPASNETSAGQIDDTDQSRPATTTAEQDDQAKPKKEKRGSLVIAPIPISSPAFGSGLIMIVGYVFKFDEKDKTSPPSWAGATGAFTNNGTRALLLGGRLYLKENKYQTTFAFGKGRANLDFFGIGRIPGRPAVSIPLELSGTIFFGEGMRNVGKNIFVGPRYQYRKLSAGIDGPRPPGGFEIPAIDLKAPSAALGFHVQRDLRDSTFYPTKGSLFDLTGDFFAPAFGSRRTYQTYKIAYNGFRQVAPKQVFAYRAMACSANGSVPFYDLCLYGFNSDLRGYTTGEFQNRRMFATQAEYRVEWKKRLGFAAFGGLGGTARTWGEFRSDQLLPAAGVGLRFNLDKKNHINYRVDLAFGREGRTVSIGVGEAF
ncbi:MAG TPA: BamA/TamA family outer membrane protein [Pyrinomonadaceae bacterium]|nr:BamA/TamA family outer membrane protein [Pyrinomonadaceae bacterium]